MSQLFCTDFFLYPKHALLKCHRNKSPVSVGPKLKVMLKQVCTNKILCKVDQLRFKIQHVITNLLVSGKDIYMHKTTTGRNNLLPCQMSATVLTR